MKAPGHIGLDIEPALRAEPWGSCAATPAGDEQLEQLYGLLDRPWFCRRHNVLFEIREHGQERIIHITRGGVPVAKWSLDRRSLVFKPAGEGVEERAGTLDCAISITVDFLDHARTKPAASAARVQRDAAHQM
jgi:hypothetical protein